MTQYNRSSPEEFIINAFTPQIAVLSTEEVENICEKNNLTFVELLLPFSKLMNDINYKDPNGAINIIKALQLSFMNIKCRPPQILTKKLLNISVSRVQDPKNHVHDIKDYHLIIPISTPWFDSWRDTFLKIQYPSDHEFTKHFLGCLLVVSTNETNPIDSMEKLVKKLNNLQTNNKSDDDDDDATIKSAKWFDQNIFKYYVFVHDNNNNQGNLKKGLAAYETLKSTYGNLNCFFLRINSRPHNPDCKEHLPDPWSQFLTNKIENNIIKNSSDTERRESLLEIGEEVNETKNLDYHPLSPTVELLEANELELEKEEFNNIIKVVKIGHGSCLSVDDIEQIKIFIYEFTKTCLIPYVEKQLGILNDGITNKKGVSKSILTATKRFFGTSKPSNSHNNGAVNNLIYAVSAPELQIRKLGDLYFMFRNYSAAFQAYHTAKREYYADQAWLYYAGALEMASLSAFLCNEPSKKTYGYMDESITTYLNICKINHFAIRATLLSIECLKAKFYHGEAAYQLIRMTSEDSDLCSALFLEQASYCFIYPCMLRKYAFHMVLAGHRFFKASQKKHSLRCYKQAYQIYENTTWDLATDHIHYTIGRLANFLHNYDDAIIPFSKLLTGESKQTAIQQASFLKEYLVILQSKLKRDASNEIPILPVPELNNSLLKILVEPTRPLSTPGKISALGINFNSCNDLNAEEKWHKLEEMLLTEETGISPLIFKPMVTLYTTPAMENFTILAIINEPIQVSIRFVNSMQLILLLKNIYLLWNFVVNNDDSNQKITNINTTNECVETYIKTHVIKSVIIKGTSEQELILSLTPLVTGKLTITAVCYTLAASATKDETISIKGNKLLNVSSDLDNNLIKPIILEIVPYAPCLQMTFSDLNLDFLSGEIQRVSIDLHNTGSVPLKNIMIATSVPHLMTNCELKNYDKNFIYNDGEDIQLKEKLLSKNHITSIPLKDGFLNNGQSISFFMWVRAPQNKGACSIDLLTYYENVNSKSIPRYRLIRHSWNLTVQESLSVDVYAQNSFKSSTKAEDLVLAIKSTNLNQIHSCTSTEITLLNIVLISNNWVLTQDIVTPKYINLNGQQSAHILFKARRKVEIDDNYTNISLTSETSKIPHLNTAYKSFSRKSHIPLLNVFNLNDKPRERDGTLLVEWKALVREGVNKKIVYGHSFVALQINREEPELSELITDAGFDLDRNLIDNNNEYDIKSDYIPKKIAYNLLYPAVVRHNFQELSFCAIPVTIVIHSIVNETLIITVDTLEERTTQNSMEKGLRPFRSYGYPLQPSDRVSWIPYGNIKRTLKPLSTISIELSVIISKSGTFDLGANLGIFCNNFDEDNIPILQLCEVATSLVVINNNNS